jgi:hypothetical protein
VLAQSIGRAGHEHVQQFSWQSVAAKVRAEYGRILRLR